MLQYSNSVNLIITPNRADLLSSDEIIRIFFGIYCTKIPQNIDWITFRLRIWLQTLPIDCFREEYVRLQFHLVCGAFATTYDLWTPSTGPLGSNQNWQAYYPDIHCKARGMENLNDKTEIILSKGCWWKVILEKYIKRNKLIKKRFMNVCKDNKYKFTSRC